MLSKCVFSLETDKKALKKDLSDMDYLRSKIVENSDMVDKKEIEKGGHSANAADDEDENENENEDEDEDEDKDEDEDENEDEEKEDDEEESTVQHTDTAYESIDKTSSQNSTKPAAQNMVSVIKQSCGSIWNSWLLDAHLFVLFIHHYRWSRAQSSQSSYEVLHSTSKR